LSGWALRQAPDHQPTKFRQKMSLVNESFGLHFTYNNQNNTLHQ
jgi:hypothetical protein